MRRVGIISLLPTILLVSPSLSGALLLLANAVLERPIERWGPTSSAVIAFAIFLGWPLAATAVVVSALLGLSRRISRPIMYTHYAIVSLAVVATYSLTLRFGM